VGGWIVFGVPPAIAFAVATLAWRFAERRIASWLAIFVFPAMLTTYRILICADFS
jgi:uncharacterized protein (TIGR03382 family)